MRNYSIKIFFPLLLVAICEYLKYSVFPDFSRQIMAVELCLAAYLSIQLIVNLYIRQYLVAKQKLAVTRLVQDTIKFFIIVVFIIIFLWGVMQWNLAAILTPSAILTAIIGLALQDTIGNFIAGLLIQVEKPFELEDWIEIEGQQGQVKELNWRYTKIETLDRYYMIVPNGKIATQKVVNYSKPTPLVNEFLSIGVSYEVPPLKVKRTIEAILRSNLRIAIGNNEGVFLHEYSDSSVVYKIKYAIRDFAYHREIRDEVLSAIWYEFKKHIIEIPYPIRTVIMKEPTPRGTDPRLTETLAQIPFFAGISKAGISNLCMFGLFRDCEEGDVIIENDKEGDSMFFVLEGSFNVIRHNQAVSVLCKGDFFGEMSLLTGEKRNARVVAKTPGRLLEIDRHAFKTVLDNEPGIMSQIENVFNIRARAIKEESPNAVKTEEIKQNFWSRFKQIFGLT